MEVRLLRVEKLARMRLEDERPRRCVERACLRDGGGDQGLVAAMHPVEIADGEHCPVRIRWDMAIPSTISSGFRLQRTPCPNSAADHEYPAVMKDWIPQIVIGIIVTVVGTVSPTRSWAATADICLPGIHFGRGG